MVWCMKLENGVVFWQVGLLYVDVCVFGGILFQFCVLVMVWMQFFDVVQVVNVLVVFGDFDDFGIVSVQIYSQCELFGVLVMGVFVKFILLVILEFFVLLIMLVVMVVLIYMLYLLFENSMRFLLKLLLFVLGGLYFFSRLIYVLIVCFYCGVLMVGCYFLLNQWLLNVLIMVDISVMFLFQFVWLCRQILYIFLVGLCSLVVNLVMLLYVGCLGIFRFVVLNRLCWQYVIEFLVQNGMVKSLLFCERLLCIVGSRLVVLQLVGMFSGVSQFFLVYSGVLQLLIVIRLNWLLLVVMLVVMCWCSIFFFSVIQCSLMLGCVCLNWFDSFCSMIMLGLLIVVIVSVVGVVCVEIVQRVGKVVRVVSLSSWDGWVILCRSVWNMQLFFFLECGDVGVLFGFVLGFE